MSLLQPDAAAAAAHAQDDLEAATDDEAHAGLLDVETGSTKQSAAIFDQVAATPPPQSTTLLVSVLIVALLLFAGGLMWIAVSDQSDEQIGVMQLQLREQHSLLQLQGEQMQNQQQALVAGLASLKGITSASLQKNQTQQAQQEVAPVPTSSAPLRAAIALPEYRLTVVYFAHLMPNWEKLLDEQLKEVSKIGLGDAADVHIVLSAPVESFIKLDDNCEALLAAGEKLAKSILPDCAVHLHAGNRQEYPAIRHLWDLGQHSTHDPSKHFFLYFHAKGMSHEAGSIRHQLMDTTVVPWRAIIARFIEDPELLKQGFQNSLQGFFWFNFYWLRGSYLRDLMAPKLDNIDPAGRYHNEGWSSYLRVGSTLAGECKTPCNWPVESRGAGRVSYPITQTFPCYGAGIDGGTGTVVGCHSGPFASRPTCGDAHWKRGEVVQPFSGIDCNGGPLLKDQPDAPQFMGDTRGRVRLIGLNDD